MTISIVGHERILEFLGRTVREGRPAHAYLFAGADGIGKKLTALRFTCMVNCDEAVVGERHECRACRKIEQGIHPDVTVVEPEKGAIRIEKVRRLRDFFRYSPVEGRYRVAIVDDAHRMNRSAQNALLKTLEEPPPGRLLVLVSARPSALLPTVRSRCRTVRFGPIPTDLLADILRTQDGLDPEKASTLAALSGGSVSRARELESPAFLQLRERLLDFMSDPGKLGVRGILDLSATLSADRETAIDGLETVSGWVRDMLVLGTTGDGSAAIHGDLLDRTGPAAQHQDSGTLIAVHDETAKAAELIEADTNINRNVVTDVLLFKVARLLAGPTLGITPGGRIRD